jgi:hypothetical protein
MTKIKNLLVNNYIPILLTALIMWGSWVTLNLRSQDSIDRQNKAQWEQIAKMKELFLNNQVLELKKEVYTLREDNRELRNMFLEFIAKPSPKK